MSIKSSLHSWRAARKAKVAPPPAAPAERIAVELEPETVAVIAAVLAVEVKMFLALQGQRFTFRQDALSQGWSEWGRLLAHPFQGVTRP